VRAVFGRRRKVEQRGAEWRCQKQREPIALHWPVIELARCRAAAMSPSSPPRLMMACAVAATRGLGTPSSPDNEDPPAPPR